MRYKLLFLLVVASFILAACDGFAPATALPPTAAATLTPVATSTQAFTPTPMDTPTAVPTAPVSNDAAVNAILATAAAQASSFDLFDRSLDYCFRVASEPVRGYNRVLEFLYGLRVEGETLVEYKPAERGVDEGTWPSRVILMNAATDRQTTCSEVEARHPIMYRMAPETDLQVLWTIAMDNIDNSSYEAAYKAASVGSNNLGLFIGSKLGTDVVIRAYDESGALISESYFRVKGEYCSDCYQGTSLVGNRGQYAPAPQNFAFETSERKVLTTDLVALALPQDFLGRYEITTSVEGGHVSEMWLGELNPLSVPATPTPTPTATPTSAP